MVRAMRTASWILLAIVGSLILLGSVASTYVAYGGVRDELGASGLTLDEVAGGRPDVATALRGRRGTAAAFAAAYAVLFLSVVLVPYRRGEVWSWWAVLAASAVLGLVVALRVPLLGTRLGAGTGVVQLAIVMLALLLDVKRLRRPPPPA
jgi:hypothetical protein